MGMLTHVHFCLSALLLFALLYLFARHTADYDFRKVILVTILITVAVKASQYALAPYLGAAIAVPLAALVVWALRRFCWVTLKQAVVITLLFAVGQLAMALLWDVWMLEASPPQATGQPP